MSSARNFSMEEKETSVRLKCACGCSAVVVENFDYGDGEVDYVISIQDSRYDHNYASFFSRIKSAAKILFDIESDRIDVFQISPRGQAYKEK